MIIKIIPLLLVFSLFGCQSEQRLPAEYTYRLRGIVVAISVDAQGKKELKMRHEAIPAFFDADGKSEPMQAMTMSFPLDSSVNTDSLQKGDEVEATYEVRWKSSPREIISALSKIPAGTVSFNKPAPLPTP